MKWCVLALILLGISAGNVQAVSVSEQVMQSGQFVKSNCTPDPKSPDYDECSCDADIRYPHIDGMKDAALQDKVNAWFKQQATAAVCEGQKTVQTPEAKAGASQAHASNSVHYEETFASPQILAFKFTDWAYTGGAHGNGSVIGTILDLQSGKFLTATDIFGAANLPAVNDAIYKMLSAKPEEEIFRDQIESRQGVFIKDGECQGCTLTLMPDGVHVLFQTYEVAPYGAGNTDVPIPVNDIVYKPLLDGVGKPKTKPQELH